MNFRRQPDQAQNEPTESEPSLGSESGGRSAVSFGYDENGLPHLGPSPELEGYFVVPSELGGGISGFPTLDFDQGTRELEDRTDSVLEGLGYPRKTGS